MKTIFLVMFAMTIIAASQVSVAAQHFKDEQFDKAARVLLGSGRSLSKAVLSDPDAVVLAKVVHAHIERGYFDDIANVIANTPYEDPVWQTVASTVGSPGSGLYRREHVAPIIRLFRESIHPGESWAQTNSIHLNIDPTGLRYWLATLLLNIVDPKNKELMEGKLLYEQPVAWLETAIARYPDALASPHLIEQSPSASLPQPNERQPDTASSLVTMGSAEIPTKLKSSWIAWCAVIVSAFGLLWLLRNKRHTKP